ncbi:hypothetical protein CCACVL1_04554 [Corchorus capsularis]|uniref:Uncharacterized protein n=1 Tax=Corchorus capsularis TaxID=210143 RepID=A0A1R3JRY5_COCAP|nr:hypothetical protein CCACVL1_04554 [Corchorus capsularis]
MASVVEKAAGSDPKKQAKKFDDHDVVEGTRKLEERRTQPLPARG